MRLSLVIPAYNERRTLGALLCLASRAMPLVEKELIVVDDHSGDGTREWLRENVPETGRTGAAFRLSNDGGLIDADGDGAATTIIAYYHPRNRGKGAAVRTGLARVSGEVVAIQDADLEYDPNDLQPMYDLIAHRRVADAVFGSRFYGNPHRSLYFHHYAANRIISLTFNMLYNQTLTDIECCYKMITSEVVRSLHLSADDFGIEIEISAALARRRGLRIYETGVSYFGRSYDEGKKIGWRDGVKALWYLVKFRFRARAA